MRLWALGETVCGFAKNLRARSLRPRIWQLPHAWRCKAISKLPGQDALRADLAQEVDACHIALLFVDL
jgi:hypothetical protein